MMRKVLTVILIGAFGAPVLAAGDAPDGNGLSACGADQVQELIGQPVDGARDRFAPEARIIPPNSPVTQDYRPDRLNVDLDAGGIITRIWCG
jgi:peptidase inhibitor I78 family protein